MIEQRNVVRLGRCRFQTWLINHPILNNYNSRHSKMAQKRGVNRETKIRQKQWLKRYTRFEAGSRVETVQYFISGTVYTFMTPVVLRCHFPISHRLIHLLLRVCIKLFLGSPFFCISSTYLASLAVRYYPTALETAVQYHKLKPLHLFESRLDSHLST